MFAALKAVAPYAAFMVASDGILSMRMGIMPPLVTVTLDLAGAVRNARDVIAYDNFDRCDEAMPSLYREK